MTQVRERRVLSPDDPRVILAGAIKLVAEGKPLANDLDGKLTTLAQSNVAKLQPEQDAQEGGLPCRCPRCDPG